MKTEREIWDAIEEIETTIEELKTMCVMCGSSKESQNKTIEPYRCMIDTLLWVVGDNSGKSLFGKEN